MDRHGVWRLQGARLCPRRCPRALARIPVLVRPGLACSHTSPSSLRPLSSFAIPVLPAPSRPRFLASCSPCCLASSCAARCASSCSPTRRRPPCTPARTNNRAHDLTAGALPRTPRVYLCTVRVHIPRGPGVVVGGWCLVFICRRATTSRSSSTGRWMAPSTSTTTSPTSTRVSTTHWQRPRAWQRPSLRLHATFSSHRNPAAAHQPRAWFGDCGIGATGRDRPGVHDV